MSRTRNSNGRALDSLRQAGMKVPGFAEGFRARDAIIQTGAMIRRMRKSAGLSQAELGRRAGMSQSEISRLETGLGSKGPSVETLGRIAYACERQLTLEAASFGAKRRRQGFVAHLSGAD